MEVVSRDARKTLNKLIEKIDSYGYVDYSIYEEFIDKNKLQIIELAKLKFVTIDMTDSVIVEPEGLIFPGKYKTKIYEDQLTGFWLPLAVSVVASIIINLIIG